MEDRRSQMMARFMAVIEQGVAAMAAEHRYQLDGEAAPGADEAAVHRTLLERVFAKRLRDFDVADQLRARLKEMGVEVHDERQLYRFRVQRGPVLATSHGYTRELANDGTDAVLSAEDEAKLDDVILERVNAKRTRDFVTADQLRANLKDSGVTIDDQRLVFRVSVRAAPAPAAPRGPMLATHHGSTRQAGGGGSATPAGNGASVPEGSTPSEGSEDGAALEMAEAKEQVASVPAEVGGAGHAVGVQQGTNPSDNPEVGVGLAAADLRERLQIPLIIGQCYLTAGGGGERRADPDEGLRGRRRGHVERLCEGLRVVRAVIRSLFAKFNRL